MNLHELRSTPPLRDADFAAIRARVNAKINDTECGGGRLARRAAGWLFAFAAVTAAFLIAVFIPREPIAVPQHPPRVVSTVHPPPPPNPTNLLEPPPRPPAIQKAALPHKRQNTLAPVKELRIHLQTSDPNIRIIWIVNPKNLKEES